jgi:VanZ family protein
MIEKTLPKIGIVAILGIVSIIGFMVKLPRVFSHHDKELHFLFYFGAAVILNYLFVKKNFLYHMIVAWILMFTGVFIECAQELSNLFVEKRIHGNFDPEDIIFNTLGLMVYSFIWVIWRILVFIKSKIK